MHWRSRQPSAPFAYPPGSGSDEAVLPRAARRISRSTKTLVPYAILADGIVEEHSLLWHDAHRHATRDSSPAASAMTVTRPDVTSKNRFTRSASVLPRSVRPGPRGESCMSGVPSPAVFEERHSRMRWTRRISQDSRPADP